MEKLWWDNMGTCKESDKCPGSNRQVWKVSSIVQLKTAASVSTWFEIIVSLCLYPIICFESELNC